jgi:hypothetical protein
MECNNGKPCFHALNGLPECAHGCAFSRTRPSTWDWIQHFAKSGNQAAAAALAHKRPAITKEGE